ALKAALGKTSAVKVGNGVLSVVGVQNIQGDAMQLKVRGEDRHTFDLSFNLQVAYKWMGANFDAGMQRAEGSVQVSDFTDATSLRSEKCPPKVRAEFPAAAGLDEAKRKQVEGAIGTGSWPPPDGSLMAEVMARMEGFVKDLTRVTTQKNRSSDDGE
ncbi:unnamed protein product, partial [Polarella glacialis]